MYMYCLELILPLSQVCEQAVEDLTDAGFDKLIARHSITSK